MTEDARHLNHSIEWRRTLQRLLSGELDYAARALGGVEAYVERILASEDNRTAAEGAFALALNDEVGSWQVGRSSAAYYVVGLIQLVGAFTPPAGFGKCVQILEGELDVSILQADTDTVLTILIAALVALSRYYPAPPPNANTDRAYGRYQAVLVRYSAIPVLAPLAMRHRFRLGLLRLRDPSFVADALRDEAIMRAGVDSAVTEPDPWSVEQLTELLNACLATGAPEALSKYLFALSAYGAPVMDNDDHVLIAPRDGVKVVLRVAPNLLSAYVKLRWTMRAPKGFRRYMELVY